MSLLGAMSVTAWLKAAVFVVAYAYIATEKLHRLVGALGDAVLTLLLAVTNLAVNADTSSSEYGPMRAQ
jgi:hypothetical protein